MRIFNHDIMTCTSDQVVGNHLYSGRALGITNPGDIIQLHPALKPEWDSIQAHYDRVGLQYSHDVIWNVSLDLICETQDCKPSVFYFGDALNSSSAEAKRFCQVDEGWFRVVEYINSKNNFIELSQQLEIAVPPTQCFSSRAAFRPVQDQSGPCYFKPSISVDGVGIKRCADQLELSQAVDNLGWEFPFQIQAEVMAKSFLNLQYQITPNGAERLAATEQILDGCSHSGNRYPVVDQPWELVEPMATWMADKGMKEIFAFDVAVSDSADGRPYLAIECNPRYNGASYPTLIARKLGIHSWSSETFFTSHRCLAELEIQDIEFDAELSKGIILVNWGTISLGKLMILLAGSLEQQAQLRATLRARLH